MEQTVFTEPTKVQEEIPAETPTENAADAADAANNASIVSNNPEAVNPPDETVVKDGIMTLERAYNNWSEDYKAGKIGNGYVKNTFEKTRDDVKAHSFPFFGKDRDITTIHEEDAEAFMDKVSFGVNLKGEKMSANGALNIYYSNRRIFDYFHSEGYVEENVFRTMDSACIPEAERSTKSIDINEEEEYCYDKMNFLLKKMLDSKSEFAAVKAVSFIYLSYKEQMSSNDLLLLTWSDVKEMSQDGELDNFIIRLLENYRIGQQKWLKGKGMTNPKGYVFAQKNVDYGSEAVPADSSFATYWMKHNMIERYPKLMPRLNINTLRGEKVDDGPLYDMDCDADYPILGKVYYYDYFTGTTLVDDPERGFVFTQASYDPERGVRREQRRVDWLANNPQVPGNSQRRGSRVKAKSRRRPRM